MNKKENKENTLKLNATLLGHTRGLIIAFLAFASASSIGAVVVDSKDKVKMTNEFNAKYSEDSELTSKTRKELAKDLTKNAIIALVAFAVVVMTVNALRFSKRRNDQAAIKIARRYMMQLRKENPVLKKYDYILNNEMALHNIAAGVVNMLPMGETIVLGTYWDLLRYKSEYIKENNVGAKLKLQNNMIHSVINDIELILKDKPNFMDDMLVLVDNSAKTFALDKYMADQKVR